MPSTLEAASSAALVEAGCAAAVGFAALPAAGFAALLGLALLEGSCVPWCGAELAAESSLLGVALAGAVAVEQAAVPNGNARRF